MKLLSRECTPYAAAGRLATLQSLLSVTAFICIAATGCSNTPLKSDKLLLARDAEAHAVSMGGNIYAPSEMEAVRERLEMARSALNSGDLQLANALSDESMVNARLAEVKVQSVKAEQSAAELRQDRRPPPSAIQDGGN